MRKRWFVHSVYPKGRGAEESAHDDLNKVRVIVENKLRKLTRPYKWFTVLQKSDSLMLGAKVEDGARVKELIETELKGEYPDLFIGFVDEDPDNCELMAIATQCRTKIEDRVPISKWTAGQIGFIIHCMLSPYGYDNEAWSYWTSLCCIDEEVDITDRDTKDAILLTRLFLEHRSGLELEDNLEKVKLMLKELDEFTDYLRKKTS